jgi:hypothetical protein
MIPFKSYFGRYISLLVLVLCAVALGSPVSTAAERNDILFESNFETGEIAHVDESVDGWHVKAVLPDHATITSSVSRESDHAIRLFIERDLDYSVISSSGKDKPRVDLLKYKLKFDYETNYWVGWSVYIPSDWVDDLSTNWTTIMQIKQPVPGSPIISQSVKGGEWHFHNRRDENDVTWKEGGTGTKTQLYQGPTKDDKGKWVDFVINFRLCVSAGCDGKIRIWKDGEQIVNVSGPNAFQLSENGGPYLVLDLYKSAWKRKESLVRTREIFFDAVRIGGPQSDYASVAPDGLGVGNVPPSRPLPPTLSADSNP